jgi:GAF domain-containing protein
MTAVLELGHLVLGEMSVEEVFSLVAELVKDTIAGADEVSVTLLRGGETYTVASTGALASTLDDCQYADEAGPCLLAATTGQPQLVADMNTETRWPPFSVRAAADGVLSSLSVALPLRDGSEGSLNMYARTRNAFDDPAQQAASNIAEYAAVALTTASLYTQTARLAEQLQQAMNSRAVIEQAKGILIAERRCTEDEAFAILTKLSQDTNRKVRDVAAALVAQAWSVWFPTGE